MPFKISGKLILLNISIFLLVSVLTIFYFFNFKSTDYIESIYVADIIGDIAPIEQPRAELPVRIIIKKINVDAKLEYVGITPKGEMDSPTNPDDAGWFDLGPRPGEIGSAVIAGHYGWKNNIPAVFDNLSKLKVGDEIYTEDASSTPTAFIVREIGIFKPSADAANVFGSTDGLAHLNLITCEGIWNANRNSYSNRLIIFTDKKI